MCTPDYRMRLNSTVSPLWKTVEALPCFVELSFVPAKSSKVPTPVFHISPRICGHSAHPWIGLTHSENSTSVTSGPRRLNLASRPSNVPCPIRTIQSAPWRFVALSVRVAWSRSRSERASFGSSSSPMPRHPDRCVRRTRRCRSSRRLIQWRTCRIRHRGRGRAHADARRDTIRKVCGLGE